MRESITGAAVGAVAIGFHWIAEVIPPGVSEWTSLLKEGGALLCAVLAIIWLLKDRTTIKSEHKAELLKKDEKIEDLEVKIGSLEKDLSDTKLQLSEVRQLLIQTTNSADVTATVRRSLLKLEERENA